MKKKVKEIGSVYLAWASDLERAYAIFKGRSRNMYLLGTRE